MNQWWVSQQVRIVCLMGINGKACEGGRAGGRDSSPAAVHCSSPHSPRPSHAAAQPFATATQPCILTQQVRRLCDVRLVAVGVVEASVVRLVHPLPKQHVERRGRREEHTRGDRDVGWDEGGHSEGDVDRLAGLRVQGRVALCRRGGAGARSQ
jgi:hypothetical protein